MKETLTITEVEAKYKLKIKIAILKEQRVGGFSGYMRPVLKSIAKYIDDNGRLPQIVLK